MAELAKVLDILRPQNKERQATHTHHSCEDVSLHLYAYSISASSQQRFLSLLVETAGLQVVPIPHLFPHYLLYIVIFDILIVYILIITYSSPYTFFLLPLCFQAGWARSTIHKFKKLVKVTWPMNLL